MIFVNKTAPEIAFFIPNTACNEPIFQVTIIENWCLFVVRDREHDAIMLKKMENEKETERTSCMLGCRGDVCAPMNTWFAFI